MAALLSSYFYLPLFSAKQMERQHLRSHSESLQTPAASAKWALIVVGRAIHVKGSWSHIRHGGWNTGSAAGNHLVFQLSALARHLCEFQETRVKFHDKQPCSYTPTDLLKSFIICRLLSSVWFKVFGTFIHKIPIHSTQNCFPYTVYKLKAKDTVPKGKKSFSWLSFKTTLHEPVFVENRIKR